MTGQVFSGIVEDAHEPELSPPNAPFSIPEFDQAMPQTIYLEVQAEDDQSEFSSVDFDSVEELKWSQSITHGNPIWCKMFVDTLMVSLSKIKTQRDQNPEPSCFWGDNQRLQAYSPWSRSRGQYYAPKRKLRKPKTPSPDMSPLQELAPADMALLYESIMSEGGLAGDATKAPSAEGSPLGDTEVTTLQRYVGQHTPTLKALLIR